MPYVTCAPSSPSTHALGLVETSRCAKILNVSSTAIPAAFEHRIGDKAQEGTAAFFEKRKPGW